MSSELTKKRLVLSIIDFLNSSLADGTVKEDDKESLEVAVQCIGEAFGVDPSSPEAPKLSIAPATLPSVFDLYLKTRDRLSGSSASTSAPSAPEPKSGPSEEEKALAEAAKRQGNASMSSRDYDSAIEHYTEAIKHDDTNPIYFSNRAAAHSSKQDHLSAIGDAERAIAIDPKFVKGYSRLGHAQYSLGDYEAAKEAFEKGLKLEPGNASMQTGLANSTAHLSAESSSRAGDVASTPSAPAAAPGAGAGGMPDLSALAGMFGGGGAGGAGGGGMPDIASMMQNPMLMQMAQQMMQNGGLERLMNNPALANMMNSAQSGGGMPDMAALMQDPTMRDLAAQFGGMGRGAGAGP